MNQLKETTEQELMIRHQIIDRGITHPRVIEAMRAVPRDHFFPFKKEDAFDDRAAPIGHGQTISQPYIVALMTERLDVQPEHRVLEIGTGSGYQAAILCKLAREVYSVERVKPLLDEAFERILSLGLRNVHFRHGDGSRGWPEEAPFDRIILTAGAPELPRHLLLTQLSDGGIAVAPVGPMDEQVLVLVRRRGNKLDVDEITGCRFVKLIGADAWPEE